MQQPRFVSSLSTSHRGEKKKQIWKLWLYFILEVWKSKRSHSKESEKKEGKNGGKEASGVIQIPQPSFSLSWPNQNIPSVSRLHCQPLYCLSSCPCSSIHPSTYVILTWKHTHTHSWHMLGLHKYYAYLHTYEHTHRQASSPPLTLPVSTLKS